MPLIQPTLRTARLEFVPLADEHLELEVGLGADPEADLGYRLLRRSWRQGPASEPSLELLRYGLQDVGLRRILAQTMAANAAPRATMASIRMTYVRAFPGDFPEPLPGREHGEVEYAITLDQWQQRNRT